MIKKIVFICSFIFLYTSVFSQNQTPLTVFLYTLNIDEAFQAELQDLDEIAEDLESIFKGKNPLAEGIIHETYDKLALQIKDSTQYGFLPIDILRETEGKKIFYTPNGYPMGSKKRAATHATSSLYTMIQVDILMRSGNSSNSDLGVYKSEKRKIRPGVRITMWIYDDKGKKVAKHTVLAKTKTKVVIQTKMMLNWFKVGEDRRMEDDDNQQIIANLIDEAISMLIYNMNQN